MLEKFLVLLERFVVAHELIAANSSKSKSVGALTVDVSTTGVEAVNAALDAAKKELEDTKPAAKKASTKKATKPEPEDEEDLADEEPPKKTAAKKSTKKEPDTTEMRDDIKEMAKAIAAGESDECADKFDDMLEDYGIRNVGKLEDKDVEDFHVELKELVAKFYEIED